VTWASTNTSVAISSGSGLAAGRRITPQSGRHVRPVRLPPARVAQICYEMARVWAPVVSNRNILQVVGNRFGDGSMPPDSAPNNRVVAG
jgi:hypothetical protein